MVGSICLWNFSEDKKTAEMGYDLMPSYQRKEIMDESVKLILHQAKDILKLELVSAYTHFENTPSRKLLERNGFIHSPNATDSNPNNLIYAVDVKIILPENLHY